MSLHFDMGEFVRERRQANGMTQRELGELAGVGTRFVSELERNKPTVRLDAVRKVLKVFGKTLAVADQPPDDSALPSVPLSSAGQIPVGGLGPGEGSCQDATPLTGDSP